MSIDITNVDEVKAYFEDLLNKKTWKDKAMSTLDEIIEHFFYNERLVWLDPIQYPNEILEKMTKYSIPVINKDLSLAEQKIQAEKNDVYDVLEEI